MLFSLKKYCCKKINSQPIKISSSSNQKQISSKMAYSQNIRNKESIYSSTYSNLLNSNISSSLLCIDNNNQTPGSGQKDCKIIIQQGVSNIQSYFLRTYITRRIIYIKPNFTETELPQYINDVVNLYNKFQSISFVRILDNYIYLIIKLYFPYTDIIEYLIINNTTNIILIKKSSTTDEQMTTHIMNIINLKNTNPNVQLFQIVDDYILGL